MVTVVAACISKRMEFLNCAALFHSQKQEAASKTIAIRRNTSSSPMWRDTWIGYRRMQMKANRPQLAEPNQSKLINQET